MNEKGPSNRGDSVNEELPHRLDTVCDGGCCLEIEFFITLTIIIILIVIIIIIGICHERVCMKTCMCLFMSADSKILALYFQVYIYIGYYL